MSRPPLAIAAGLLAPLVYLATVLVGGWLTPGYSHNAQAVSELFQAGAPHKRLIDGLFILYNLLVVLFGLGVRRALQERDAPAPILAPVLLIVTGLLGILMTAVFPMDPRGSPATFGGQMHVVLAGLISLATMATLFFMARALRADAEWRRFAGYTSVSLGLVIATGLFAAWGAFRGSPVMGVWERLTIFFFLQWVFIFALVLWPRGEAVEEGDEDEE